MPNREKYAGTPEASAAEATALCNRLNAITDQTWTPDHGRDNEPSYWMFHIKDEKGRRLHINLREADKKNNPKYVVSVSWPRGRSYRVNETEDNQTFGVGYNRGIDALAGSIKQRVLPYLFEWWPKQLAVIASIDGDAQAAATQRLDERFGNPPHSNGGTRETIYGKFGIWKVQVNHDGTGASVEIRETLPMDMVDKLIDFMEANYKERR